MGKLFCYCTTVLLSLLCIAGCPSRPNPVTYVIGTDMYSAPFSFFDNDTAKGIDVELFTAIAADRKIRFEFMEYPFPQIFEHLNNNEVDAIMDAITITPERALTFDFSGSYLNTGIVLAVDAKRSDINGYEDLRGYAVSVIEGTTWEHYAKSIQTQYGFEILHCPNMQSVYAAVLSGVAAGCFDDEPELSYQIAIGLPLQIVGEPELPGSFGLVVKKGMHPQLLQEFNIGLANIKANGTYDKIIAKYLGSR